MYDGGSADQQIEIVYWTAHPSKHHFLAGVFSQHRINAENPTNEKSLKLLNVLAVKRASFRRAVFYTKQQFGDCNLRQKTTRNTRFGNELFDTKFVLQCMNAHICIE